MARHSKQHSLITPPHYSCLFPINRRSVCGIRESIRTLGGGMECAGRITTFLNCLDQLILFRLGHASRFIIPYQYVNRTPDL